MNTELMVAPAELSVVDVRAQVNKIQELMKSVMVEGVHYGRIPGTSKDTLYKAGAEKLGFVFRMAPEFEITMTKVANNHREYQVIGTLRHIGSGVLLAQGVGMCSTMESKYRWRESKKKCPKCGEETIFKSKKEEGGWFCWAKKGGCGAQFKNDDPIIESQKTGKVENPDIADTYNTVLKMGKKRCYVDMTITACAASDVLNQDIEDIPPVGNSDGKKTEQKTEQKNGAPKDPERQKIIYEIAAIIENDKFTDDDRTKARVEISLIKSNIALEALRAAWQNKLDRIGGDFVDDDPEEAAKDGSREKLTDEQMADLEKTADQGWFTDEEKAAKEAAEKKALQEPDIY